MVFKSKYGAKKTVIDGIKFDSKKEAARYVELKKKEATGEIKNLELQPKFLIIEKQPQYKERAAHYIADFGYYCTIRNKWIIEDVKGVKTKDYKLKRKLFLQRYGEIYGFEEI